MSTAYWAQWDHSEIMSMHGVELDEMVDDEIDFDHEDEEEIEEEGCCGNCMDCLGLSWSDFY